jgi:hypothetical protein
MLPLKRRLLIWYLSRYSNSWRFLLAAAILWPKKITPFKDPQFWMLIRSSITAYLDDDISRFG